MKRKFVHFLLLAALVAVSSLALADPPTRVGRVSAIEGQVTMLVNGEHETGNLLNWPVTNGNHITTAPGARTEFRVGSAAVRLDGDSDIEVLDLDEDSMRLRLNYGTASVRIRDPQMLSGFDLRTPQARIVMTEPGTVRVDTERAPDTTTVSILAGAAQVEGGGVYTNGQAGKRIEVRGDELYSSLAVRDRFDDWVQSRDRREEGLPAARYLPSDVTGYEELDQYGTWIDNPEYGTLWTPRLVPSGWAPYRDGRWVWVDPWGWTWVDNAPWGYAPSHYGRWVVVNSRWCWAPGRFVGRAVWAPAMVGWVGGSNWSVSIGSYSGPGVGWYPLSPRDRFVPAYRVTPAYENRFAWHHRSNDRWQERFRDRDHDGRRDGVTVLPRDQFERRRSIVVPTVPRGRTPDVRNVVQAPPPAPVDRPAWRDTRAAGIDSNGDGRPDRFVGGNRNNFIDRNGDGRPDNNVRDSRNDRNGDGRPDRFVGGNRNNLIDRNGDGRPDNVARDNRNNMIDRNGDGRPDNIVRENRNDGRPDRFTRDGADRDHDGIPDWRERQRNEQPRTVTTMPHAPGAVAAPQPQQGVLSTTPPPSRPQAAEDRNARQRDMRNRDDDDRDRRNNWREARNERPGGVHVQTQPQAQPQMQMQPQPQPQPQPQVQQPRQQPWQARERDRGDRADREPPQMRERHQAPQPQPQPQPQMQAQMPQMAPARPAPAMPAPPPQARQEQPRQERQERNEGRREHGGDRGDRGERGRENSR
ncbi:DUF6600 domain-containing protein [Pseudoduganella sp. UC29_106]|uniref:DUF6600 domain-containing protein n=1 Tax=Pseudoduganella sp. UC29_106 TaxID=3374553 RepID=UPI003757CE50